MRTLTVRTLLARESLLQPLEEPEFEHHMGLPFEIQRRREAGVPRGSIVSTEGSPYRISDGLQLCTNGTRIQRFHSIRVSFERKADSPIYWKR
jgi:hypothetical protein